MKYLISSIAVLILSGSAFAQTAPVLPSGAINGEVTVDASVGGAPIAEQQSEAPQKIRQSMYRLTLRPGAFNRMTFEYPFSDIILSPDLPISVEPTKTANNQTLIVEIDKGAKGEYQGYAQLLDGSMVELILRIDADAPPLSWTQPSSQPFGAEAPQDREPIQRRDDVWFKDVFFSLVSGQTPDEFMRVAPPSGGQIGKLRAKYVAAFRNSSYVILVAKLYSKIPGWIAEQDLYVPGVKAVLLDGQQVGGSNVPTAYIIMSAE